MIKMKALSFVILFFILFNLYIIEVTALDSQKKGGVDEPSDSGNSFPSDFSGDGTGGSASVPPPNPIIINGVQIKDYRGLSASGNSIKFSSATYAKSSSFSF